MSRWFSLPVFRRPSCMFHHVMLLPDCQARVFNRWATVRSKIKKVGKQSTNVHAGQAWWVDLLKFWTKWYTKWAPCYPFICLPACMSIWKLTRKDLQVMLTSLSDGTKNINTRKFSWGSGSMPACNYSIIVIHWAALTNTRNHIWADGRVVCIADNFASKQPSKGVCKSITAAVKIK